MSRHRTRRPLGGQIVAAVTLTLLAGAGIGALVAVFWLWLVPEVMFP